MIPDGGHTCPPYELRAEPQGGHIVPTVTADHFPVFENSADCSFTTWFTTSV